MRLRHELEVAWAVLVVVQVLTLAGAVGLLARMTPAIGEILSDNEFSIQAVETMLIEVGASDQPGEGRARFEQALADAQANVTEPEERGPLESIEARYPAAFAGDLAARQQVTQSLRTLSQINRGAMDEAASRASGIGRTGAWAAVILGLSSLGLAFGLARRVERRVVAPTEAIASAVEAIGKGDAYRRCPVTGPSELAELAAAIERWRPQLAGRPVDAKAEDEDAERDARDRERRILLAMLDDLPGAAYVLDDSGDVLHANVRGTAAMLSDPAIIAPFGRQPEDTDGWSRRTLGEGIHLVQTVQPMPSSSDEETGDHGRD